MALGSIQCVSDSRSFALEHESIVHGSSNNATEDGHKERDQEVKALGGEDLTAVDDS